MPERALVVVPTYNERENLPQIVPAILAQDPRLDVLVVDDGSPDGTGQLADAMAADAVLFGAVGGPKWDKVPYQALSLIHI